MQVRKYNRILRKVEYPTGDGYRMEPILLPYGFHITITEDNGSKYLTLHSRGYADGETRFNPSYSAEFDDYTLIAELSEDIRRVFSW